MMILEPEEGTVRNFYSLENKRIDNEYPDLQTFGAVYLDKAEYYDDTPYIYTAFLMQDRMQFIKLAQEVPDESYAFPRIKYHYEFKDLDDSQFDAFFRQHRPEVIFTVPYENDSIFIAGKYRGNGSVMKFNKRSANLHWYTRFDKFTQVNAIATVPDIREEYMFGCGQESYEDRDRNGNRENEGWIFKLNDYGDMYWALQIEGGRPNRQSKDNNVCSGLTYDTSTTSITALVQTKSKEFRDGPTIGDWNDIMLLIVSS